MNYFYILVFFFVLSMLYFVHGLNGSANDWKKYIDFFSKKGFECKAIDLQKGVDLRKAHITDYIDKVCFHVGKDDVVIGHSMGGLIMQKVAERIELKAGIGICSAPPRGIALDSISWWKQIRYIPYMLLGIPFKPSFRLVRNVFLSGWSEKRQRKIYQQLRKQSAYVTYEVMKQQISVDEKKISAPLYFIGRKNDVTIPVDVIRNIADKYHSSYDVVDGNHYIFIDWKKVAEKILVFLQKINRVT